MKKYSIGVIVVFLWVTFLGSAEATLVAEYLFNGNANDTSGFNQNGTFVGGATFGPGKFGQALVLDGTTGYLHVNFGNHTLSNFTIELWVNVPTYSSNAHYVSLYQNAYLVLGDYATGGINTWADGLTPIEVDANSLGLTTGQWHHLAFTYDGSVQRVFVDGVQVAAPAATGSVTLNTASFNSGLNIGARYAGNTQFVKGSIENVRIYDTAFSDIATGFFHGWANCHNCRANNERVGNDNLPSACRPRFCVLYKKTEDESLSKLF